MVRNGNIQALNEWKKTHPEENKAKQAERSKRYRARQKAREEADPLFAAVMKAKRRAWPSSSKTKRNEYSRRSYADARRSVFEHYGNLCACCGEEEPLFLTIDHVNGDGAKHRRSLRKQHTKMGGSAFYYWLSTHGFPEGFQTLCLNCNMGKWRNKGVCPHKTNTAVYVGEGSITRCSSS